MIVFGVFMLAMLYAIYVLLIKGVLWDLILFFGGWFGIYVALRVYVDGATHTAVTISNYQFSWAVVVPTIICVCAMACKES